MQKQEKKCGLGIKNLKKMNVSLLCKWWWKLEKEDGLWQRIVRYKYLRNNSIHNVSHKLNDSHIWSDLLKVKEVYLLGRDVSIKDGCYTRFWKDAWLYQQPLCEIAPVLFALCNLKDVMVDQVRNEVSIITFRRWLPEDLRLQWEKILSDVSTFNFGNGSDMVLWSLEKNNKFSVKSM